MNAKSTLSLVIGSAFAATVVMSPVVNAAQNPFASQSLSQGYMTAEAGKATDAKCSADKKTADAKCSADKKATDAKCSANKKATDAKCSANKKATDAKCSADKKAADAKCAAAK